jgi:hypothetical protein
MISDIAAAVGFVQLNSHPAQRGFGRQHMVFMPVAADCHDMRVLDKQQVIFAQTLLAFGRYLLLNSQCVSVAHPAQIAHHAASRPTRHYALMAIP